MKNLKKINFDSFSNQIVNFKFDLQYHISNNYLVRIKLLKFYLENEMKYMIMQTKLDFKKD